jgi:hypothetical protein
VRREKYLPLLEIETWFLGRRVRRQFTLSTETYLHVILKNSMYRPITPLIPHEPR